MALVRVYCGVATAEMAPWLTVAVVDDSGRLLEMRHISDDPAGYAYLSSLLTDRSGGAAPVAIDSHEHLVAQLLAAANRPLAIADEHALADFSNRFADDTSYDEMQAPATQRLAVGLARALQAGALYATAQSPSWDLDELKPVLSSHAAVTAGRQAAAVALREVLRELYPAALRAYPDPAEYVPLRILDALPEPGLLTTSPSSRNRDAALIADLSASGMTDTPTAVNAITALRVAVEESPRWQANRTMAPVVAETVRQAVAAVRACDAASAALVSSLVERLAAMSNGAPVRPYLVHPAPNDLADVPVSPAVPRRPPGPAAEVPPNRLSQRTSAASAAAAGVGAGGFSVPSQRSEHDDDFAQVYAAAGVSAYSSPAYPPAPGQGGFHTPSYPGAEPGFGQSRYADPEYRDPALGEQGFRDPGFPHTGYENTGYQNTGFQDSGYQDTGYQNPGYENTGYQNTGYQDPGYQDPAYQNPGYPNPGFQDPGVQDPRFQDPRYQDPQFQDPRYQDPRTQDPRTQDPGFRTPGYEVPAAYQPPAYEAPSRYEQPSAYQAPPPQSPLPSYSAPLYPGYGANASSTTLSFDVDPLNAPLGAARETPLRLVERKPIDPLTDPLPGQGPPALRLVDSGRDLGRTDETRRGEPTEQPADDDLLIFSQTNSAWFTKMDDFAIAEEPPSWATLADDGWRAAEQVASPTVGDDTTAGLPRRVPQANLVPGTAQSSEPTLRIVRDAQSIASHTDGYFRGWRRGQEIGGFAVGQRDRAAWEFNREQRMRDGTEDRARLS